MKVILFLLLLLAFPAFAEEPKVYTDQDLEKLNKTTSYDQETILQREAELNRWEKENEEAKLLNKKREAEEEKRKREATRQLKASEKTTKKTTDNTLRAKKKRS